MPKVYRLILLKTLEFSCCLYYNLYFLNLQEENSNFSYFFAYFLNPAVFYLKTLSLFEIFEVVGVAAGQ